MNLQLPGAVTHTLAVQQPSITIELAGEPKGKGRPRFHRATGRAYTPEPTRRYEDMLRFAAAEVMAGRRPLEEALCVTVDADMAVPASWSKRKQTQALHGLVRPTARPDADNLVKMLDALNSIVWRDDKQIVELTVVKRYSARPRLKIRVQPI